ncbi:hypothetical protein in strongly transcribed region [Corynebacterium glutamicum MB001]|nr:hypothetical protein in strongly transcribed region [Corynebacterium glutamicum MB001]ASW12895.1 hypothetical protein cgc1_4018 [Corynebacterium glutamicum]QYO72351.1 hypothetical protein cgisf_4018 [Corynebacterium glutamicum]
MVRLLVGVAILASVLDEQ